MKEKVGSTTGVVLVTGGASGIGKATVELLSSKGRNVIALDISESVHSLRKSNVVTVQGDVTSLQDLNWTLEKGKAEFGPIYGAVAAAGITAAGTVDSMDIGTWSRVIETNLTAVFLLAKAVTPEFRRLGYGSFVAVASQVGLVGYPNNVAYCAAKAGVINLVRALAIDEGPFNIRANSVCPGPVDTPMLREGFQQTGEDVSIVSERVPLKRVAKAREIARAISLLIDPDDPVFASGAAWTLDGGYTAQ